MKSVDAGGGYTSSKRLWSPMMEQFSECQLAKQYAKSLQSYGAPPLAARFALSPSTIHGGTRRYEVGQGTIAGVSEKQANAGMQR